MAHMKEKWLIPVIFEELNTFIAFSVRKILPSLPRCERRDTRPPFIQVVRIEVCGRLPDLPPADVDIKSLFIRKPGLITQMPLPDVTGRVSCRLQHFGDRDLVQFHPVGIGRTEKPSFLPAHEVHGVLFLLKGVLPFFIQMVDPVRDSYPGRIPPCHDGCACG